MINAPYLLFLGDAPDDLAAKVAKGIRDWRPDLCVGQLRLDGCKTDVGLSDMSIAEAAAAGAKTLVVGVANRGGVISASWLDALTQALEAGMDVASGLHNLLRDEPVLVETAERCGRRLFDVRIPDRDFPIGNGKRRTGKRLLTVGTDCSVGKMYATLALERDMRAAGFDADFRATGQTGILITGSGVPLDAVVADFMAGSIEVLTPDGEPDHWDLVEGQGSLFHPSYSGVTMALIHGSAPDALVICHEPTRTHMRGLPHYDLPTLQQVHDSALAHAQRVNPDCRVIGSAINTSGLGDADTAACLDACAQALSLPSVDPMKTGCGPLIEQLR
ncbi:MAG: N-acetyltransferase DgcN [Pseudomonadota bacterium]